MNPPWPGLPAQANDCGNGCAGVRWPAELSGTVVVANTLGIASTAGQWRRAPEERQEAALQSYVASLKIVEDHLRLGETTRAKELLLAQPEALRGWEWGRLPAQAHDRLMSVSLDLPEPDSRELDLEVSPNGEVFVVLKAGVVEARSTVTGARLARMGSVHEPITGISFLPDGRRLHGRTWAACAGVGPRRRARDSPGGGDHEHRTGDEHQ